MCDHTYTHDGNLPEQWHLACEVEEEHATSWDGQKMHKSGKYGWLDSLSDGSKTAWWLKEPFKKTTLVQVSEGTWLSPNLVESYKNGDLILVPRV